MPRTLPQPERPLAKPARLAVRLCGVAALGCGLLASGCALEPKLQKWEADFYYTERLYMDGQTELAQKRFAALRKSATDPRDADEAALLECEVQAHARKAEEATACYDQLATTAIDAAMRARAVLHAAELRFYDLHREDQGLALWRALVQRSTDQPAALRALDHLYLYGQLDLAKRNQMVALFLQLEHADPRSEIADNLLLRAAMLLEQDGSPAACKLGAELLERQERDHREDATIVDCIMTRSRLYRRLGQLDLEARDLEKVVDFYETSYVFASYGFDEQKTAALRLIELYRGPLHDLDRAEFHARNLPEMLRKPLKMPAFLVTLAEVQEQKGNKLRALDTYREVLRFVDRRNQDFRKNDQRICNEIEDADERDRCLRGLQDSTDVEPRECNLARERITRLETELRRPHLSQAADGPARGQP